MNLRVMLVDDCEDDQFFTQRAFARCGVPHELETFAEGSAALSRLQSTVDQPISLVVLDINMPGMDGYEFLSKLETLGPEVNGRVIVVMLSSSTDSVDRERAAAFSLVKGYVVKPLDVASAGRMLALVDCESVESSAKAPDHSM